MVTYLFPFDKVEKGSKIIIYGASEIGNNYLEQLKALDYCNCLFFVDRNFENIQLLQGIEVCSKEKIEDVEYDIIVIAAIDKDKSIMQTLLQMKIPQEKIVHNVTKLVIPQVHHLPDPKNTSYWDDYYMKAEKAAQGQFNQYLNPILKRYDDIDFSKTMDFACGRGRMANIFSSISKSITCCDINSTAIDFCKNRFQDNIDCNFDFKINTRIGSVLEQLEFEDSSFTFIYSWDAMVHFTYKWLDFYLKEFARILANNSYVLIHHSNYANVPINGEKSEDWMSNPHGRTNVNKEDINFLANKHGFSVIEQNVIDWEVKNLDCISLLKVIKN